MENNSNEISEKEITKLNGSSVMSALAFLKTEATENEIFGCFQASNDELENRVQQEVKHILEFGVINGFIVRNGDKYALPGLENRFQIDSGRGPAKRRKYDSEDSENEDTCPFYDLTTPPIANYLEIPPSASPPRANECDDLEYVP